MSRVAEQHESLWFLAASPVIWAAHFTLSYATAAVFCAKQSTAVASLASVRVAIGAYTAVALGAIAIVGWRAWRAHRLGAEPAPHDADSAADRHRFMGFAALLLSGLSALAVIYAALVAVIVETCQ